MTALGEYCRSDNANLRRETDTAGSMVDAAEMAASYSAESNHINKGWGSTIIGSWFTFVLTRESTPVI